MKSTHLPQKLKDKLIKSANLFPVVGIGASAGGLDAFKKLLKAIPENSGMAYVLVQHLDPNHESLLPEILQRITNIPVLEISDDMKVEPDHIYVIPSNKVMIATDGVLLLSPRPEKNKTERHLPIDLFFSSLAEVHQTHAIGVVLSGTASDGTLGLKAIKDHGGITFAQDEASAEYESMPSSAAQAGVVDFILPPEKIPQKLLEVTRKIVISDEELQNFPQQDEDVFKQILSLLRIRKGVDFTYYKQTTIRRRILRRMVVNKNEEPAAYLKYLRENKSEQDLLYQDMLIPVTSFFRDKKTFENICVNVFPVIIKNKVPGDITRIWVAGCSTGQEVFSFAICFKEFLGDRHERIQIFGTDLSEPAIIKARTGIYDKNELDSVSVQRLKEHFTKTNGSYQVNKNIRDMCVFAHHNFLKDPPFGKMDCISCRNVLIYMEPYLQKKALTTFHYALNPKGFLLLGKSETTGGVPDLFTPVGKSDKLYTRKDVPGRFMQVTSQRSEQILSRAHETSKIETIRTDFQKTADDILLRKYTPAGVVINESMDIVHFRGNTGLYLEQAPGKPSHNLLMMAKHGLAFELRNILHKAKKEQVPIVKENIPLDVNGSLRNISIEAIPLPNTVESYHLILFHDNSLNDNTSTGSAEIRKNKKVSGKRQVDDKEVRIKLLEQELFLLRDDMRSITEDQEASNEELQSANEELLSGSEELQSLNEELETSKEELQSTNEELTVLNHELVSLNEQLTNSRNYSESIIATLSQPLLVLDKNLRVKTANKAFYKAFKVDMQETEDVLIYDLDNRQWKIPQLRILLEEILPHKTQITDFEVIHHFSALGERVMILNAVEIVRESKEEKLILLSIEDITERKKAEKLITESNESFRQLVKELPAAVYSCDAQGNLLFYNNAAAKLWGYEPEIGKDYWQRTFKMINSDGTLLTIDKSPIHIISEQGLPVISEEIIIERTDGTRSIVLVHQQTEFSLSGEVTGAIYMLFDVTEQVTSRKRIEESEKQFSILANNIQNLAWMANADGWIFWYNDRWYDYTGTTLEEMQGWGWQSVHDPEQLPFVLERWQQSISTGSIFDMEFPLRGADKVFRPFLTRVMPMKNSEGKVIRWIGTNTDITEQKRQAKIVEQSENQFRQMAELMPQKVWTADARGNKNYFNKKWFDYTGFTFEELKDWGWLNVIHPGDREKTRKQWQQSIDTGMDYEIENRLLRKDGKYFWHLTRAIPIKEEDGKIKNWLGSKTEIQEQREQKEELEKAVENRTYELRQANDSLEEKNEELEKMNVELQSFNYISSHDLQEPLRNIQMFASRIAEKEYQNLSEEGKHYFKIMQDAAFRMQTLIEDLIDYFKTNNEDRVFIKTDLTLIVQEVINEFKELIAEKQATLDVSHLSEAYIIPFQFRQLLHNLIGNALKFSKPDRPPHLTIMSRIGLGLDLDSVHLVAQTLYCHISIADNGIGFEPEYREKIFEVFQRLHGRDKYKGTGIGLAVVKKIVENHKGYITATGKLNEGATFDIYIPSR